MIARPTLARRDISRYLLCCMKRRSTWLFTVSIALFATGLAAGQEPDQRDQKARDSAGSAAQAGQATSAESAARADIVPPGPKALPDLPDTARFVVVDLHEEVTLGMASFVERVAQGLGTGDVLVLDINTFGGRVDAAVTIRDALLDLQIRGAMSVAYIHPRAISAGALISLATDVIVVAPGATIGAATPVRQGEGGKMEAVEEKTVSYMRKEMRATAEARGRNGDIAEAMVDAEIEVPGLIASGKLLTLDGTQALDWGIASAEAATLEQALAELGFSKDGQRAYEIEHIGWSWAERLAAFLTGSMLSGLLMSIGMLGLLIGLYTGGSPVPLTLGGLCLGLFFFGHHVVDLAGFEEILLFALGTGLLLFEVFAPGHILPGVLGVVMILASLIMGLVSFESVPIEVQWNQGWILNALGIVFGSVAATAVLSIAAFQLLPDTKLGRAFLLETTIAARATDKSDSQNQSVVGDLGKALSDLRPAGKVSVAGRRYDAVAEIGHVPAGADLEVRSVRGFSLVVAVVEKGDSDAESAADSTAANKGDMT